MVDVLDSQDAANLALLARPELGITLTKIHAWNLVQYTKAVFLDADTLVRMALLDWLIDCFNLIAFIDWLIDWLIALLALIWLIDWLLAFLWFDCSIDWLIEVSFACDFFLPSPLIFTWNSCWDILFYLGPAKRWRSFWAGRIVGSSWCRVAGLLQHRRLRLPPQRPDLCESH